jgi:hypothetical protein
MKSLPSLLSQEETIGLTLFHQIHLYDYLRIILYAGAYNGKSINLLKAD